MPGILDHVLAAILILLGPVWGATFGYRRLLRASAERRPRVRMSLYAMAMAVQWGLVLATAVLWIVSGRTLREIGLEPRATTGLAGVAAGFAIKFVLIRRQRTTALRDDEALAEVRERMHHVEPMLPREPHELRRFYALSITAGICEEILYRGFMIWFLTSYLGPWLALGASAVVFGIGHSYQGVRGILLTTLVGAFLAGVYFISGSLYPGIVMHALMDIHSGHLAYVALRRAPVIPEPDMANLEAWADSVLAETPPEEHR